MLTKTTRNISCGILGLTLGGFLYNSVGAATFLISTLAIFAVFVVSFKLLKWKEA